MREGRSGRLPDVGNGRNGAGRERRGFLGHAKGLAWISHGASVFALAAMRADSNSRVRKLLCGGQTVVLRKAFNARLASRGHCKSWRQKDKRPFRAARAYDEMPTLRPAVDGSGQAVWGLHQGAPARARGFRSVAQGACVAGEPLDGDAVCPGADHADVGATAGLATTCRVVRRRPGGDRSRLPCSARSRSSAHSRTGSRRRPFAYAIVGAT